MRLGRLSVSLFIFNQSCIDADNATINIAHDAKGLLISPNEAARHEKETAARLMSERKLLLILDLDQTILQATVDPSVSEWRADPASPNHKVLQVLRRSSNQRIYRCFNYPPTILLTISNCDLEQENFSLVSVNYSKCTSTPWEHGRMVTSPSLIFKKRMK